MRLIRRAILVGISLVLAACAERPQAPNWQVELRLLPEAPRAMEDVSFALRLRTPLGEAVTGANVELGLSMPGHRRGDERIRLSETEAGIYTGAGRFTISGDWQVEVRIRKGSHQQSEPFNFQIQ